MEASIGHPIHPEALRNLQKKLVPPQAHLIITKQCEVDTSDDGDGDVEPCARETVKLLHL